jgi:leucyl-tRNA synthetase
MAVPAHDPRDYEFAAAFKLDVRPVVAAADSSPAAQLPCAGDGVLVDSSNAAVGLQLNGAARASKQQRTHVCVPPCRERVSLRSAPQVFPPPMRPRACARGSRSVQSVHAR